MARCKIISMEVDVTDLNESLLLIERMASSNIGAYVCVSNVHMCMEVKEYPYFKKIVNGANLIIPDGRPIYWAQKLLGEKNCNHIRGLDLMGALCERSSQRNINIGLYGGSSDEVLMKVCSELKAAYPKIKIKYKFSPPYRKLTEQEDECVVKDINTSDVGVLFVGIGCPKQEIWMAEHKDKINCVMIGVGAAFDFISGNKKHAPRLMQLLGVEWLFRLCCEPKRLWRRYLKHNPRFIFYLLKQIIIKRT